MRAIHRSASRGLYAGRDRAGVRISQRSLTVQEVPVRARILRRAALAGAGAALIAAGSAGAVAGLPSDGAQVNDDPAPIDPGAERRASDVAGGALAAGGPACPGRRSSRSVGRLAADLRPRLQERRLGDAGSRVAQHRPDAEAEAPSIDFAGRGSHRALGRLVRAERAARRPTNIFASRFNAAANRWLPSGQDRGAAHPVAQHPHEHGGEPLGRRRRHGRGQRPRALDHMGGERRRRRLRTATTDLRLEGRQAGRRRQPCTGFKPSDGDNVNGFCLQQVGLDRLARGGGSSPTRATRP